MSDKSMFFSGLMVRAMLEGRKTQTRRLLKLNGQKPDFVGGVGMESDPSCWGWEHPDGGHITVGDCRDSVMNWSDWRGAYRVGDRLWVRETWTARMTHGWAIADARSRMYGEHILYRADGDDSIDGWWPSIHMPREFSRLTLIVENVRVQQLQYITLGDIARRVSQLRSMTSNLSSAGSMISQTSGTA